MAEPDWALWQSILQQLQADSTELKKDVSELKSDVKEIKADVRSSKLQVRYAIGSADVAEQQSAEVQGTTRELKEQLSELTARVEALEKTH